jgi:DNA end-binding protein Ku
MVRAIWSGSVSFGLVNVPVKVVTAVRSKDVRFRMLHDADAAPIEQKRVCSVEGQEVEYEHIVKGYKVGADRYVVVTPEELEALDPEATRTIDIQDFVDLSEVDPIYFEHPYYLVPDKGAGKAYGLLVEALRRSNRAGIARVVLRTKEHLVALRPMDDVLAMTTLLYHDEVVQPSSLEVEETRGAPNEKEIAMAEQLIDALATGFDPTKYHDMYRERVLDYLEKKAAGETVSVPAPKAEGPRPVDLVSALQASLEAARRKGKVEA